ncbi:MULTISPECIES: hypothetical protein [Klebsiella pneumoniae complex]|uniref:hypothetical protein n=1 Tax=Klebsiella pneumoniae complex TaxID=3390273 RepID=UPI000741B0FF|nr:MULTISPECIES: hypothetical protein [Klebsiella]HDU6218078.1 hypothetical protein [Klebsiella pneumoniae subsp. ozaenae]EIV7923410.1 hypothetical protein [Klebsiella pneumoniae]EIV7929368.1 hypothetical protein [Klebsiella pneumoniae]EKX8304465.1 hypothetical protein [Klebsiella pneumoniae]ELA2826597.1 hypothetical protein [Klebsiella variicola]
MAFNPELGSTSPAVLLDNATRLDNLLNSLELAIPDREGVDLDTWRGIMAKVASSIDDIRQNLIPLSKQYQTLAAAQADIANIPLGATTYYRSPDDSELAIEVMNVSGTLQPTGRKMPSQQAIDALLQYISSLISNDPSVTPFVQWEDVGGFILAQLDKDYLKTAGFEVGAKRLSMDSMDTEATNVPEIVLQDEHGFIIQRQTSQYLENSAGKFIPADNNDYVIEDEHGFHIFSVMKTGTPASSEEALSAARDAYIAKMDNLALAASAAVNNTLVTGIQRPVFDYNLVITDGQSLSTGTEGWAALSTVAFEAENLLMFGDSVRPSTDRATGGSTWNPLGGAALKPLKAVTQSIGGGSVLTDAEVSALAPGAVNEGETVDVGAVNFWRQLQNDFHGVSVDPARKIIVLNCGVQGRTVEELSKGHPYNHYNRVIEAVTKVKSYIASQQPGATVGIVAFLYMQGEWNYWTSTTGTHDRATFLELTKQLRTDLITDCAYSICGQKLPPAWITYQTGGSYTDDTYNLAIGMAQLDMAEQVPGCYLATPVYQVTDKNGHLDPNGYRWAGMQFGKVLHRILDRGLDWKPMKPIKVVRYSDDEILACFNTPSPPAKFKETYVVNTATMYPNKGFLVTDANGVVGVSSVTTVGQATLSVKLSAPATGDVYLWYAPKTTYNGNGNLCDSDSTIAPYNYEYHAGSGQYPSANITALVDKPYPLENWCCAFRIKVEEK